MSGFKTYRDFREIITDFPDPNAAKFFDMDGVLTKYDWAAYLVETRPGVKLYMDENMHYFRTCEPDPAAIGLLASFHDAGFPVFILTSVKSTIPWARYDKIYWIRKHIPWFDCASRFILCDGDKAQMAMARARMAGLSRDMLLFDDFNPNLDDWRRAGGTPVKYLNGVNTPGTSLSPQFDPRDYF